MKTKTEGLLIAFDGIGGSGKSTAAAKVAAWLIGLGLEVITTKEPGGTPLGSHLRKLMISQEYDFNPDALTEVFIFEADRRETYKKIIHPALGLGKIVITDRSYFGTVAYQGYGKGVSIDFIDKMTSWATSDHKPSRRYLLDLPVEAAMHRRAIEKTDDRFDVGEKNFQEKVRSGFLFSYQRESDITLVIDSNRSTDYVFDEIKLDFIRHFSHILPNNLTKESSI